MATDFAAFRAAYYNAAEIEVIRVALAKHIKERLDAEPERRKLFEAEKKRLLGERAPKLTVLHPEKDSYSKTYPHGSRRREAPSRSMGPP